VIWVAAWWVIAAMENLPPCWNRTEDQSPCHTVGRLILTSYVQAAITALILRACPDMATFGMEGVDPDLGEKSIGPIGLYGHVRAGSFILANPSTVIPSRYYTMGEQGFVTRLSPVYAFDYWSRIPMVRLHPLYGLLRRLASNKPPFHVPLAHHTGR
jgi:hypothetical protein